jgi:Ca-activated chloride channel family protein
VATPAPELAAVEAPEAEESAPVDKIDVKSLGTNKALNKDMTGGALADLFASEDAAPTAKATTGKRRRAAAGTGGRGTSTGGAKLGGRVSGRGQVDIGGGKSAGGALGKIGTKGPKLNSQKVQIRFGDSGPVVGRAVTPEPAPHKMSDGDAFKNHGVNPMVSTAKDKLSTFAIDVDTGAYTIARRQLQGGALPSPSSVRVEEYVNYFAYNYPSPASGAFAVSMEAAPSPFEASANRYLLRVGVQGKRIGAKERKPVHLTFLVDVSGSMSSPDKLPLAQQSLKILTNTLREGDTVALVTYAGDTRVVLPATDAADKAYILSAIDDLSSGGSTAMASGMELAYKEALASHKKGHVSRVIVLSDGDANVGKTSHDQILKSIKGYVDKGVTLSTIGFGAGNYKDHMMEQLANKGNGNYYYIDTIKEARKVFGEQVSGTLEVIAKDVKLQVEFDPEKVSKYRLIGYENRDIADKDFRDDKVDAGEIGAGHTVTAYYEVVFKGAPQAGFATVRVRHKKPEAYTASEAAFVVAAGDLRAKLSDSSKDFQFGAAVVAFAELLRGSPYARGLKLDLVEELATAASSPNQRDRAEFINLVQKAKALFSP